MKRFKCACGASVYFDAASCLHCGGTLAFDPTNLDIIRIAPGTDGVWTDLSGLEYRRCANTANQYQCTWLVSDTIIDSLCVSCRLNRTVPDLDDPENLRLLTKIEAAKRRLLYSLLALGLRVQSKVRGWPLGLAFDFVDDQRTNPDAEEEFALTGHENGVITLNINEADDVMRVEVREAMNERYRTVLGHMRHESGHYYFEQLVTFGPALEEVRALFGDERQDYAAALERAYKKGPPVDWQQRYISAYASAHPLEDWAETWAHYLHIIDTLETAVAYGLHPSVDEGIGAQLNAWTGFSVSLNEITRSLGLADAYPFVISSLAAEKLCLVDRVIKTAALVE